MQHFFLNSSCHLYQVSFQFLCSNFIAIFSCQIQHNSAFSNNLTLSKASLLFFTSILLAIVTKTFAVQMQVWKYKLVKHKFRPSQTFLLLTLSQKMSDFNYLYLYISQIYYFFFLKSSLSRFLCACVCVFHSIFLVNKYAKILKITIRQDFCIKIVFQPILKKCHFY